MKSFSHQLRRRSLFRLKHFISCSFLHRDGAPAWFLLRDFDEIKIPLRYQIVIIWLCMFHECERPKTKGEFERKGSYPISVPIAHSFGKIFIFSMRAQHMHTYCTINSTCDGSHSKYGYCRWMRPEQIRQQWAKWKEDVIDKLVGEEAIDLRWLSSAPCSQRTPGIGDDAGRVPRPIRN